MVRKGFGTGHWRSLNNSGILSYQTEKKRAYGATWDVSRYVLNVLKTVNHQDKMSKIDLSGNVRLPEERDEKPLST